MWTKERAHDVKPRLARALRYSIIGCYGKEVKVYYNQDSISVIDNKARQDAFACRWEDDILWNDGKTEIKKKNPLLQTDEVDERRL